MCSCHSGKKFLPLSKDPPQGLLGWVFTTKDDSVPHGHRSYESHKVDKDFMDVGNESKSINTKKDLFKDMDVLGCLQRAKLAGKAGVRHSRTGKATAYWHGNGKTVGGDVTDGAGEERAEAVYQRMKWTNEMVKILIIAVCYIEACVLSSIDPARAGRWRVISGIFAERGYRASAQQCEDKFNVLNRRYRRLNEILGGNTSRVVENPEFMELMDLTDEAKEEARRILGSKQLFYQEMWSYHNQNWSFLPHDPTVKKSVMLAIKGKDKCDAETPPPGMPTKRMRCQEHGVVDLDRTPDYHNPQSTDVNNMPNTELGSGLQENQIMSRIFELTETKLQIQEQILELKNQLFHKQKFHHEQEKMLAILRSENEALRLANEHLSLKLRRAK
nr:uncharacterized protein LOC104212013 isoform X3 [Ipomoea batatas]GMD08852.1 uncharacterized protein LOC104212013 isoform X3 [Ipomoea batatas]GMD10064.1 uncharacterized protein LOC104212013 isoform X3 [Ipomoea batatas]